ncbi:MAG: carbamoyltransferase C-terminal domain-containing protein [Candidatus Micrarchaeia archaeon]
MAIIGIHDAHDAGAGLVENGEILGAINEERFTRKKNDVGFPANSIKYLLGIAGGRIEKIAVPWYGGSALFARIMPSLEVNRRKLWRKEIPKPSRLGMHMRNVVFRAVQDQRPKWLWKSVGTSVGKSVFAKRLKPYGLDKEIVFVEHHVAHAATAYYASGFKEAIVLTIDGAGDGLSGSVSIGDNGTLKRVNEFKASASIGILYGAATIALDMRYSEDEGKLMSLAAYSYPSEIPELDNIIRYDEKKKQLVSNTNIKFEYLLAENMKDNILWKYNREAFAYAVQRHVENQIIKIVKQYMKETGIRNIAVSGGFFSNVITNMLINELPEVKGFFVFPHMGDGGLATGAAYYLDFKENGKFNSKQIDNLYYGPEYSNSEIEKTLKRYANEKKIRYEERKDIVKYTAERIAKKNDIVLWFQGRMEYGPRALGNRSVIALANDPENRNKLNIIIKRRPYYQPFASTILEEDAKKLLDPYPRPNRFMTVGYNVVKEYRNDLVAASHVDGTTRPQVLGEENRRFRELIKAIKKETGIGAVVNTSFNKHGVPIVMDPDYAIWTLLNTGSKYLSIGDFFVEKI